MITDYQKTLNKLNEYNLSPQDSVNRNNDAELARDRFYESIDDTIYERTTPEEYTALQANHTTLPLHLLSTQQRDALAIIQGTFRMSASQYPSEYLRLLGKTENKKVTAECDRAIASLIKHCGDKAPADYTRSDINTFINESCQIKKTSTVLRQLKSLSAIFNRVALEMDFTEDQQHSFKNFNIPNLGNDSEDRKEFNSQQIDQIRGMAASRTPEIDHLIHLMLDTGMRIKECVGLKIEDIKIDADTPHLFLYRNNVRNLKTKSSRRVIPLVGSALLAMKNATAAQLDEFVFPRYVDKAQSQVRNTSADAACNKRLRSILGSESPTCHSFRHSLQTRLRNVECPKDIRDELGGWAKDISDKYGSPSDLRVKAKYLKLTL